MQLVATPVILSPGICSKKWVFKKLYDYKSTSIALKTDHSHIIMSLVGTREARKRIRSGSFLNRALKKKGIQRLRKTSGELSYYEGKLLMFANTVFTLKFSNTY